MPLVVIITGKQYNGSLWMKRGCNDSAATRSEQEMNCWNQRGKAHADKNIKAYAN